MKEKKQNFLALIRSLRVFFLLAALVTLFAAPLWAAPPGKVWVPGHQTPDGRWIPGHYE
jgi:hypothetical protein